MAIDYVANGNPDGTVVGTTASDKVGFFGATPVAQQAVVTVATASSLAQVITGVQSILTELKNLGLIASS